MIPHSVRYDSGLECAAFVVVRVAGDCRSPLPYEKPMPIPALPCACQREGGSPFGNLRILTTNGAVGQSAVAPAVVGMALRLMCPAPSPTLSLSAEGWVAFGAAGLFVAGQMAYLG